MTVNDLVGEIPARYEYTLTVQKIGYRYFCDVELANTLGPLHFNCSSNDLEVALKLISDNLRQVKLKASS